MKRITSDALGLVNQSLGLGGGNSAVTELDDGIINQTLDINGLARRGRAFAGNDGIFRSVLQNTHLAANTQTSFVRPYAAGVAAIPPFPSTMPAEYDVWLLSAAVTRVSGSGNGSGILLLANVPQGVGIDQAGALITTATVAVVALFDIQQTIGGTTFLRSGPTSFPQVNTRIPRNRQGTALTELTHVDFISDSGAAAVYECIMYWGLFPRGLGQDAGF